MIGRRRRLFVLVAVFKAGMAGREHLDRFSEEAAQYASTVGGRLTNAGAMAVAVVEAGGGDNPGNWAAAAPAGRSRAFPVYVDIGAGRVSCPPAPEDLRRLVEQHVTASVRSV